MFEALNPALLILKEFLMSQGAKRRRNGMVEPPRLEELCSPAKRSRLQANPRSKPFTSWSTEEVSSFLCEKGLPEAVAKAFVGKLDRPPLHVRSEQRDRFGFPLQIMR